MSPLLSTNALITELFWVRVDLFALTASNNRRTTREKRGLYDCK